MMTAGLTVSGDEALLVHDEKKTTQARCGGVHL